MKTQVLYRLSHQGSPQVLVAQSCPTLLQPHGLSPFQAPLFMEFSRPEYCSGKPFLSLGDLPDPGIELGSPALQVGPLLSEHQAGLKKKKVVFVCQMRQWRPKNPQLCPALPSSAQGREFASFLHYLPVMSFWASFFISELQPPFSKKG